MAVNRRHISLREGCVLINGVTILDGVKCTITFTPDVSENKVLGQQGTSRRWLGGDVKGSITEYRSTPWLQDAIKTYQNGGATPEFTIQGIMDDGNSDYYDDNGSTVATASGCVLTGDITLINLDSSGDTVQDNVSFGAYSLKI